MCKYIIQTCPYPNQDAIKNALFLPDSKGKWKDCTVVKPWGRLSCGQLVVFHNYPNSGITIKCKWCSAAVAAAATRSPEVQDHAWKQMDEYTDKIKKSPLATKMGETIENLEKQIIKLQGDRWTKANEDAIADATGDVIKFKNSPDFSSDEGAGSGAEKSSASSLPFF